MRAWICRRDVGMDILTISACKSIFNRLFLGYFKALTDRIGRYTRVIVFCFRSVSLSSICGFNFKARGRCNEPQSGGNLKPPFLFAAAPRTLHAFNCTCLI